MLLIERVRARRRSERKLLAVLFVDIAGSTDRLAALGDRAWTETLEDFRTVVRSELRRFRGQEVDNAGDGFFATFSMPCDAIRCAVEIGRSVERLGLKVRAGLHIGEVEVLGRERVSGIAVHIGSRIAGCACAGQVLVSRTLRDLVAGSGIKLRSNSTEVLKGLPDEWQVYEVVEA